MTILKTIQGITTLMSEGNKLFRFVILHSKYKLPVYTYTSEKITPERKRIVELGSIYRLFFSNRPESCTKTCPPSRWYSSAPADYYLKISNLLLQ